MEGIDIFLITSIGQNSTPCKTSKPGKTGCKFRNQGKANESNKSRVTCIPKSFLCLIHCLNNLFPNLYVTLISYKSADGKCLDITSDDDLNKAYLSGMKIEKYLQVYVYATDKPNFGKCLNEQSAPEVIKECYLVPCYKKHSAQEKCPKCQNSDLLNLYDEPKLKTLRYIILSEIKSYLPKLQLALSSSNNASIHESITCNNCGACNIQGVRYKCSICMNFDFCESCEKNYSHEHPFIKIRNPDQAPKVILCAIDDKKGKNKPKNRQCDAETRLLCRFVKDVIGNEDDVHEPGSVFIKSWRLRNDGKTEWPEGCRLVFTNGDFGGDDAILPELLPGEEQDITVTCRCPDKDGRYNSYWRAVDPLGNRFGQRLTIKIIVKRQDGRKIDDIDTLNEIFKNPELVKQAYERAGRSVQKAAEILIGWSLGTGS